MREQLNNSLLVNTDGKGSAFSTWVSFAEIYNENVYDLLEPIGLGRQKRQNLALGVDNKGQVYIKGKTFVSKILERFVAYCLHGLVTSNFFFLFYELIYQLNAIEYLLCTFSSTCFGLTRPSSGAMDVKFLYTYTSYGVLGVVRCRS